MGLGAAVNSDLNSPFVKAGVQPQQESPMSEDTKTKLVNAVKATKHTLWRWIGSMFMELKPDPEGEMHQAMSLTRVLTLVCFLGCFGIWVIQKVDPPDMMIYTLWGLLGLKGLTNFKTVE